MNNVIELETGEIHFETEIDYFLGDLEIIVDAKTLHRALEAGEEFESWIVNIIDRGRYQHGYHYNCNDVIPNKYNLSLGMARDIAAMTTSERGIIVRQFVEDLQNDQWQRDWRKSHDDAFKLLVNPAARRQLIWLNRIVDGQGSEARFFNAHEFLKDTERKDIWSESDIREQRLINEIVFSKEALSEIAKIGT